MREHAAMEVVRAAGDHAVLLPAGCVVAAVLGLVLSPRFAVPAAALVIAATQLVVRSPGALGAVPAAITFFLGASVVRRLRDDRRAARAALRQARLDEEERALAAAMAERSRMARELHDVLAHSLAALSVQLEAAHALLAPPGQTSEARALVDAGRVLVREGLDDARRAIEALDGAHEMPDALHGLGARFERATGVPCAVTIEGRLRALPPGGDLALYRAAQEALTNALKHGAPTDVRMTLHQLAGVVELRVDHVTATGNRPRAGPVGGQRGLRGLRERAEALGGSLVAAPTDGGFGLRMTIPNG
jgi:signal transduction histidine kinase